MSKSKHFTVFVTEESIVSYVVWDCESAEEAEDKVMAGEVDGKHISCDTMLVEVLPL